MCREKVKNLAVNRDPILLCGNKCDARDAAVTDTDSFMELRTNMRGIESILFALFDRLAEGEATSD
jgi:hypothetical protein